MPKLVVITEGLTGLSVELSGTPASIGRAYGNALQIIETTVSSRHCEVLLRGDELHIRDLRSTNGTFVQGKRVTDAVLKPGQTFRVGQVELRYEASAPAMPPGFAPKAPSVPSPVSPPTTTKVPVVPSGDGGKGLAPVIPKSAGRVSPKADVPVVPAASAPVPVVPVVPVVAAPAPPPAPVVPPPATPTKKSHVLFVDDDEQFLATFSELCLVFSEKSWEIYSAPTADRALSLLQKFSIDLVVLDITMPMVDGVQLLGIISQRHPDVKVAILTGTGTEANRAHCLSRGAELFIEKPVAREGFKVVFNMLNELVAWTHREGFSGTIRQVGLQEVIQMECLGRHSSVLEVRNLKTHGMIYIESGAIVHATTGAITGEKALQRLLGLSGGQFKLQAFTPPPERTMHGSWEFLLMEAARVRDEETDTTLRTRAASLAASKTPPAAEVKLPGDLFKRATEPAKPAVEPVKPPPEPIKPPAEPAKPSADSEPGGHLQHALGDDVVVVATYDSKDGKWNPADGPPPADHGKPAEHGNNGKAADGEKK